jgi:ribonuclease HI
VEGESTLAVRLRKDLGVEGKRETNFLPINPQRAEAKVYVLEKKEALKVAQITDEGLILWTDGSRLEDGRVGCAVV